MIPIFTLVRTILELEGTITSGNLGFWRRDFENDKLRITGDIDGYTREYEWIAIQLKLKSESNSSGFNAFGLPRHSNNNPDMFVCFWKNDGSDEPSLYPEYLRPGRWQKYIQKLYDEIQENSKVIRGLNRKAVDDSSLFPDFDDDK